jgi:hypothetical protein
MYRLGDSPFKKDGLWSGLNSGGRTTPKKACEASSTEPSPVRRTSWYASWTVSMLSHNHQNITSVSGLNPWHL